MSFGKRDRPSQIGNMMMQQSILNESGFRSEIMMEGQEIEDFSDESLFGQDKIEELIDKKNSFMRSGAGGPESSFRSKIGKQARTNNDDEESQISPGVDVGSVRGSGKDMTNQRQQSQGQLQQPLSNSPSMNYLLANCFNFD